MQKTAYLFLTAILFILSCNPLKKVVQQKSLDNLVGMMTGSFNSEAQAAKDSSYYNITLHMYPIWENLKSDKKYLYVEQTVTSMPAKPYRQRIYEVSQINATQFKSVIYTLPDEKSYVGKWTTPTFFNKISPTDLTIREGCAVYLNKKSDQHYAGSTNESDCKSTLRGASYATSIVTIKPGQVLSWDQGFDDKGEQVWGAVKGAYEFLETQ